MAGTFHHAEDDGKFAYVYLCDVPYFQPKLNGSTPEETSGVGWFKRKDVSDLDLVDKFREDWEDVFENGVNELDEGKEKAKKEPTEKEKKEVPKEEVEETSDLNEDPENLNLFIEFARHLNDEGIVDLKEDDKIETDEDLLMNTDKISRSINRERTLAVIIGIIGLFAMLLLWYLLDLFITKPIKKAILLEAIHKYTTPTI